MLKAIDGVADGRRDFDFLFGRWRIANRKQANPLATRGTEWLEFEGLGNIETYSAPPSPEESHLRLWRCGCSRRRPGSGGSGGRPHSDRACSSYR